MWPSWVFGSSGFPSDRPPQLTLPSQKGPYRAMNFNIFQGLKDFTGIDQTGTEHVLARAFFAIYDYRDSEFPKKQIPKNGTL